MLRQMLAGFETQTFPSGSCTRQNAREPEVFDSEESYLCLVVDVRWPAEGHLRVLHPYTARDPETRELLFGWTDGQNYVDHIERSIHEDHARVYAWVRWEGDPPDFTRVQELPRALGSPA